MSKKKTKQTKTRKKNERKKKEERREWAGLEPGSFGSLRLFLTTTLLRLPLRHLGEKFFLFNAFSTENPPANAIKDDRAT